LENELLIPISKLKEGSNLFKFKLKKTFFTDYEFNDAKSFDIDTIIEIYCSSFFLNTNLSLKGTINVLCDVCYDDLKVNIDIAYSDKINISSENNKDLTSLKITNNNEIDLSNFIYECCLLSIPMKKTHSLKECNKANIDILDKYLLHNDDSNI
jgi:uncharacterized metal-binding protein YceD (DUF177 family)